MGKPDHYSTLGISPTATADQIRRAYRTLAKRLHPDTNPPAGAAAEFARVAEAYQTLGNPAKRRDYDAVLSAKTAEHRQGGGSAHGHYAWANVASPRKEPPADISEIDELYDTFFVPPTGRSGGRSGQRKRRLPRGA